MSEQKAAEWGAGIRLMRSGDTVAIWIGECGALLSLSEAMGLAESLSPERIAAAEARGRAAATADVVAFLRATMQAPRRSSQAAYAYRAILDMADYIERGEHVGAAGGRPPA